MVSLLTYLLTLECSTLARPYFSLYEEGQLLARVNFRSICYSHSWYCFLSPRHFQKETYDDFWKERRRHYVQWNLALLHKNCKSRRNGLLLQGCALKFHQRNWRGFGFGNLRQDSELSSLSWMNFLESS